VPVTHIHVTHIHVPIDLELCVTEIKGKANKGVFSLFAATRENKT